MKKIGLVAWKTGENSFGATVPYLEFFSQFGTVELIMPNETEIRKDLDLMVLPGGPDVDPMRYLSEDEGLSFQMGKQCPFRERFDTVLLPKYVEQRVPLFGVCRGHQSLAVYFGGTLTQHMWHEQNGLNRAEEVHRLQFSKEELAKSLFSKLGFNANKSYGVNSIHHQVVNDVPNNAIVLATYCPPKMLNYEHGEVEVLGYVDYPAYTIQFHAEETFDELSTLLIEDLLYNAKTSTLMQLADVEILSN